MTSTAVTTNLHNWHHEDYDEAKRQIWQHLGDIGDIEVFGRQVVVAVYVRPNMTLKGVYQTTSTQREDIWQGKAVLIVKCGPDAFEGDDSYMRAMFGHRTPPKVGDWVFLRSSEGLPFSLIGDGASRAKAKDHLNKEIDIYDWDGWPCRFVSDEAIIARANKAHAIV